MTEGRRLVAVGAVLALGAAICYSHVLGEPARDRDNDRWHAERDRPPTPQADSTVDDLAASKFSTSPVVTYRTPEGETLFALQVKPDLPARPAGPTDYVVVIDTSASQARGPLALAEKLTEGLVAGLAADDRVAILTASVHCKDLTRGLKRGEDTKAALQTLRDEYPAGATNLNEAVNTALKTFDPRPGRRQALVYMGDGMSLRDPITPEERAALGARLAEQRVAFFPVPLGDRLDPQTLHGFAVATGGAPVRVLPGDRPEDTLKRLRETVAAPILYPESFKFQGDVADVFPAKMPPLRGDSPTLVMGKVRGDKVGYSVSGTVDGERLSCARTEALPESEVENFFLVSLLDQWRSEKDAPALLRADRALSYASETNQLARADLLAQGEWALQEKKVEAARKLFEQAHRLDPHNAEAKAGLEVIDKLHDGKMTWDQLEEKLNPKADDTGVRIEKGADGVRVRRERLLALQQAEQRRPDAPINPQPAPEPPDVLKEARQRQAVEDQRMTQVVDDAVRQAARMLRTDPDAAHDFLKRTLDGVRTNPDLDERTRQALAGRLEANLRGVDAQGPLIKRDIEDRAERAIQAQNIRAAAAAELSVEERIRERMRVFHNLMNEGREEEAQRQAQAIRQDLVNQGLPVPPAVTAGYIVGQAGHNLREFQELVRIREDRWLATLLQVEKSGVPFPDEPPVAYPPAAVWREITALRKGRYESSDLGPETPQRTKDMRDKLQAPVKFSGFDADPKMTLQEALDHLADRFDMTFDVNEAAFKAEMVEDVLSKPVAEKPIPKMVNVSLDTVLRKILARIPAQSGVTYIIRRDTIEITTGAYALAEKVVRVYPVADLVIPIPNAFNSQAVQQGSIQGLGGVGILGGLNGGLGAGGGGFGAFGALGGGLGALGALGGGLGALGGGLGGLGALGGNLGGGLGALGGGLGGQGGVIGQLGGQANLGFGGGVLGFGGGQLGQLGNLGGQFGLQGGNQSQLLIQLIRQVIGTPRDWAPLRGTNVFGLPNQNNQMDDPNSDPLGNDLGFYPPAMALVVKGTSRVNTRLGNPIINPNAPPPGMGMAPRDNGNNALARIEGKNHNTKVAPANDHDPDKDAKTVKGRKLPMEDADPRTVWQEALAKGVNEPGLIIATADYLAQSGKFDHAAEFLKANLRQGIVVRPWVYEALAVALRETKAPPEEIERAETSAADLQPLDAQGYLRASDALARNKNYDAALAFCRQAALVQPEAPSAYESALRYAGQSKDPQARASVEWAAGNLLRRDWAEDNQKLHASAKIQLEAVARALDGTDPDGAARLREALARDRERDLVIRLSWAGPADLDLKVLEPTGAVCSWMNRKTVGGGTLIGDTLPTADRRRNDANMENAETYVAAQAFSGNYKVTVDVVWGRPLGGKAKLEIVQHQGTPRETIRTVTINLAEGNTTSVTLADGRRAEAASVPPPGAERRPEPAAEGASTGDVLSQLNAMTDATDVGGGIRGGVTGFGVAADQVKVVKPTKARDEQVAYQTRVAPFAGNAADITAQATISSDRRYVRLSFNAMFDLVTRTQQQPTVTTPILP